eukprot:TRINITY_DN5679_c0_g2_i4.p1 TRINITY_DN5679_c0_g2~~TRINITY_DN5679_c0_g2_i4.p1  ORF type:complete len:102 (-),score=4.65 TRINITY_DN5679_c0_g2_i4:148-453(-)
MVKAFAAVVVRSDKLKSDVEPCDVVDEECASSGAVVRASDRPEGFLSGLKSQVSIRKDRTSNRIPDLKLDVLRVNGDHASAKLNSDSHFVLLTESLVDELQ